MKRTMVLAVLLFAASIVSAQDFEIVQRFGSWTVLLRPETLLDTPTWMAISADDRQAIAFIEGKVRVAIRFEQYLGTADRTTGHNWTVILATDVAGAMRFSGGTLIRNSTLMWDGAEALRLIELLYQQGATKAQMRTQTSARIDEHLRDGFPLEGERSINQKVLSIADALARTVVNAYLDLTPDAIEAVAFLLAKAEEAR